MLRGDWQTDNDVERWLDNVMSGQVKWSQVPEPGEGAETQWLSGEFWPRCGECVLIPPPPSTPPPPRSPSPPPVPPEATGGGEGAAAEGGEGAAAEGGG